MTAIDAPNSATPAADRPVTVLLVDDQPIVGEAVRRMFAAEADVCFHHCSDPTKAIEQANAVQPTVILQDLVMPEVDGLTLVKFYRANPATRRSPADRAVHEGGGRDQGPGLRHRRQRLPRQAAGQAGTDRPRPLPLARLHRPAGTQRGLPQAGREPGDAGRGGGPGGPLRRLAVAGAADEGADPGGLAIRPLDAAGRRFVRLPLARPRPLRLLPARRERPRRRRVAAVGVGDERARLAGAARRRFPRPRPRAGRPQQRLSDGEAR